MAEAIGTPVIIDGVLQGVDYLFVKAGDQLSVHTHGVADIHYTVMTKGSVECYGRPAIEGKVLEAGRIVNWRPGEAHGFRALEDGTKMYNPLKNTG